ncbi:MAG: hypothetical protein M3R70_06580 [Actinomycetota bacterium]|nr:hypothetical protein [Actinomycetota bacterium]
MTSIREQLEATHRGVVAGDHVEAAIARVDWEQSGLLGRLKRVSRPDEPVRLEGRVAENRSTDIAA